LLLPQVPIVAGGHHATAAPERLLDSKAIDFVILGEGEERMVEFVKLLSTQNLGQLNDLDGIAFVSCGQIKINQQKYAIENLDNLSQPNQDNDLAMILTSRGCPKNCNFCSVAKVVGKKIRYRTIASVIAEMEIYLNKGILKFDFEDDNLTFNRQRAHRLFSAIKSQFAGKNLILSAMNGLMADSFDEELIRTMKEAGFEWLNIPLVSGSEQVQKKLSVINHGNNF
jgi:radical SAM superfamily enzyme YgiQ (UPF0313 family)